MAENWIPPEDISDIFFKFKCRITDIAKALNIHRGTLHRKLKEDPELKRKFKEVEDSLDREWVDSASKTINYLNMLADKRPAVALRAAIYILDRKGKKYGWGDGESINVNDLATIAKGLRDGTIKQMDNVNF